MRNCKVLQKKIYFNFGGFIETNIKFRDRVIFIKMLMVGFILINKLFF